MKEWVAVPMLHKEKWEYLALRALGPVGGQEIS